MGRLAHLQQSLGPAASQPRSSCIVVDYSCPDHCGDWVEQHFPAVQVVRVPDQPGFNPARARNRGAAAAKAPWLCFFDADVILDANFAAQALSRVQAGNYYVAQPGRKALTGTVVCAREDFLRVGGYDEVYQGWAEEDLDLYDHFLFCGMKRQGFPQEWLTPIAHADDLRVQHHALKSPQVSQTINVLYRRAKYDLMRQIARELTEEERRGLHAEASRLVQNCLQNRQETQWRIPYRLSTSSLGLEYSASLVYTMKPDSSNTAPA